MLQNSWQEQIASLSTVLAHHREVQESQMSLVAVARDRKQGSLGSSSL